MTAEYDAARQNHARELTPIVDPIEYACAQDDAAPSIPFDEALKAMMDAQADAVWKLQHPDAEPLDPSNPSAGWNFWPARK